MNPQNVLIVDDDPSILDHLGASLAGSGFAVQTAGDAERAYRQLHSHEPDALVLDISLGQSFVSGTFVDDGLSLLRLLRSETDVPVIMLSATTADTVKILALELGADDYVTKPCSAGELSARLRAVLRRGGRGRQGTSPGGGLNFGRLAIDPATHEVRLGGRPVELTLTEFRMLEALARAHGRVLTRRQLLEAAHGAEHYGDHRAVDVHIRHLRQKLEDDPGKPEMLLTVRGVGYRFGSAGAAG